jgi:hypothetical protein
MKMDTSPAPPLKVFIDNPLENKEFFPKIEEFMWALLDPWEKSNLRNKYGAKSGIVTATAGGRKKYRHQRL